jgi:hypothetical protein
MEPSKLFRYFPIFIVSFFIFGCASITGTSMQSVTVTAVCESSQIVKGAMCTISNDKGQWVVESPGSIIIKKSLGDLTASCRNEKSNGALVIKSTNNANIWGNVLAGGPIGALVDSNTGAGFNYQQMITVQMFGQCIKN